MARDPKSVEELALHERFILGVCAPNGCNPTDHRLVLEGVIWIERTGAPRRDLPGEFGN